MTQYKVTREFIDGTLKGLTHTGVTSVRYEVGFVCLKPVGGSPYKIIAVEPENEAKRRELHTGPLAEARGALRPHSLIASQRTWQKQASVNGVAAWGYAYENGEFTR